MEAFLELFDREMLNVVFWSNTLKQYLLVLVFFLALFIVFRIFRLVILKKIAVLVSRSRNSFDDQIVKIIEDIPHAFYWFISFYIAIQWLVLPSIWDSVFNGVFVVVGVFQVVRSLQVFLEFCLTGYSKNKAEQEQTIFHGLSLILRIVLWGVGFLVILSNLGFNINSLIASLGIGGIAVALALQNILADVFSSFSIYFDKPFKIGDYINVGEHEGTVKKIGLKTTRIETLHGEELVIANQELTNCRVKNYRKMKTRRIAFNIAVEYGTTVKRLKNITKIVEKIISSVDGVTFGRAHFREFGDHSLNFEIVYFVNDRDYAFYMDRQHEINFAILEAFEKEKIGFAYPTQTLHLKK